MNFFVAMAIVLKKILDNSGVIPKAEQRCFELFMEIPILNIVWFLYLTFIYLTDYNLKFIFRS